MGSVPMDAISPEVPDVEKEAEPTVLPKYHEEARTADDFGSSVKPMVSGVMLISPIHTQRCRKYLPARQIPVKILTDELKNAATSPTGDL